MTTTELPRNDDGSLMAYVWPGGYPLYYLDKQSSILCPGCAAKSERDNQDFPDFLPVATRINYEDPCLYCDDCSRRIESAYADDEGTEI